MAVMRSRRLNVGSGVGRKLKSFRSGFWPWRLLPWLLWLFYAFMRVMPIKRENIDE